MAGARSSSPAWSQRRLAGSAGQPLMAAALTGATCPAGPRAAVSSPRSRGEPSAAQIFHTVWADTGMPWPARSEAIWVTLSPRPRMAITLWRSSPVAFVGPLGPGLASANSRIRPVRSRVAIWCTLAVEYPKASATCAAGRSSTK